MMYQGGKTKIARRIAGLIASNRENRTTYVEPFLGSAAIFSLVAPTFDRAIGTDIQTDLAMMWHHAVFRGWQAPYTLTEDEYRQYRDDPEPSPMRAFAAYPCSFAGKRFGGYARDPKSPTNEFPRRGAQSIERRAAALRSAPGAIELYVADYRDPYIDYHVSSDTVVYCDPPYADTLQYRGADGFDHAEFWDVMRRWDARGALVLVSEYTAPDDWESILDIERHVSTALDNSGARAVDRVFRRKGGIL